MAYRFPKSGSLAATHVTPHTMECLEQPERLPTRKEAKAQAKNFFASSASGANGLYSMALLADDSIGLCFFGIRGADRVVWNFGKAE